MKLINTPYVSTLLLSAFVCSSQAVTISYDETLYQSGVTADASKLTAAVDMSFNTSSKVLTILLQNTSLAGALDGTGLAAGMLSGITFNLPANISITGGTITPVGTQSPNPWNLTTANQQWGYANDGTGGALSHALLSYNREASTMSSDANVQFDSTGGNIDGLNYGAVSANLAAPGSPNVVDTIQLDLILSGNINLSDIDGSSIAVIFGSADSSTNNRTPDGGSSVLLLGMALSAVAAVGRFKKFSR